MLRRVIKPLITEMGLRKLQENPGGSSTEHIKSITPEASQQMASCS